MAQIVWVVVEQGGLVVVFEVEIKQDNQVIPFTDGVVKELLVQVFRLIQQMVMEGVAVQEQVVEMMIVQRVEVVGQIARVQRQDMMKDMVMEVLVILLVVQT
jgi:hypothetical protein